MRSTAANWEAIGSLSTAVAAAIALLGIFPTLWVYRRQNRQARAVAVRALIGAILRDSRQIYYLTRDSVVEVPESQIRAFRNKLGDSANTDTFCTNFLKVGGFVTWSAFMAGYATTPTYSLINHLWNEIDPSSSELSGKLKIFRYLVEIIENNSRRAWLPLLSYSLAGELASKPEVRKSWREITDLDTLTLEVTTRLQQELVKVLRPDIVKRIEYMVLSVEDLCGAINKMSDRSVLRLSTDQKFDWDGLIVVSTAPSVPRAIRHKDPAADEGSATAATKAWNEIREEEEDQEWEDLAEIDKLLKDLEPEVPANIFTKLQGQISMCRETYSPADQRAKLPGRDWGGMFFR